MTNRRAPWVRTPEPPARPTDAELAALTDLATGRRGGPTLEELVRMAERRARRGAVTYDRAGGPWETEHGTIYAVRLPADMHDRHELVGTLATIAGETYTVRNVDLHMHCAPWREGETIGLLVEPMEGEK